MNPSRAKGTQANFTTVLQSDVPQGRNGKHKKIVIKMLNDLDALRDDSAIRVPVAALGDSIANVRAALSRASRKSGRKIATAADAEFLYIWNERA